MIDTLLSNRYRLASKLGSGGMSTVYLATDETLGRKVAVKVMHREISDQADQLERFRREARAVAQLSHPNLVGVIDAGEDGGHPYIVFEYVPGETLKKRVEAEGRLGLDEAAAYAIEVGRGLNAAHQAKLIHRDVKPQNVLIDADGRAKITDFGIARSLEAHGLTATGRVLGTTDYVSPEQAMGKDVDTRTDVYSLGILLYEMLAGDVPFHAETQVGVAMKHVNDAVPDIQKKRPETSSILAATLEYATAKDPRDRYPDMGAFLADLESALEVEVSRAGHSTGEATTVLKSVPGPRRKFLTPRSISWATAAILALAATAAIALAVFTGEEGPSKKPTVEEVAAQDLEVISLEQVTDFDPPPGDLQEGSTRLGNATDGDPTSTAWASETYEGTAGADLNGKPGIGLVLDPGEEVRAAQVQVTTPMPGWTAEIYGTAASTPPETLGEWGKKISSSTEIDANEQAIEIRGLQEYRYYLLWITQLAPAIDDDGDSYRVEVSDVSLLG